MFKKFVMEDPEFVALARQAAALDTASHPMLLEGQFPWGMSFGSKWPLDLTPFPSLADALNSAQTLYGEALSLVKGLVTPVTFSDIAMRQC